MLRRLPDLTTVGPRLRAVAGSSRARLVTTVLASVLVANSCGAGATFTFQDAATVTADAGIVPGLSTSLGGAASTTPVTSLGLDAATRPAAEATAAATSTSYVVPETVVLQEPRLVLRPEADRTGAAVIASHATEGVAHVASVGEVDGTHFAVGDIGHAVSVLAVDPFTFRALTPEVTAQAPAVWERLIAGDVLVRHDVAARFGLELGATYPMRREGGGEVLARIGALASNGAPPFADVVVSWQTAQQLGDPGVDLLVIGLHEGANPTKVGETIVGDVGGTFDVREAASKQTAEIVGGTTRFEPFVYTDFGDGMIAIDPDWVARNIVRVDLPRLGPVRVHRIMAPQLMAAMREIQSLGLLEHFKPDQFGGGWVPRHIDWKSSKPLSNHAWGLAVDFNTVDNCLGCRPVMDATIVDVFRRWGFKWGGDWGRPDGMHFELQSVVVPTG